jgi:hypothetical protein
MGGSLGRFSLGHKMQGVCGVEQNTPERPRRFGVAGATGETA